MKDVFKVFLYSALLTIVLFATCNLLSYSEAHRDQCIAFADIAERQNRTIQAVVMIGGLEIGHEFASSAILSIEAAARQCRRFGHTRARIRATLQRVRETRDQLALRVFQQA